MLPISAILIGLLALAYAVALLSLRKGLGRLPAGNEESKPKVSVVVAARNEEQHISTLLRSLCTQDYPAEDLEIIVVDDRSEDATAAIVASFAKRYPQVHLFQVAETIPSFSPKKRALTLGIEKATGEIILTTDADCSPGPRWVSGMVRHFSPEVGLVAGFSPLEASENPNSIFAKLLALDSLALACVAAGGIGLGKPLSCTGRNLAYRRAAFLEIGGFRQIRTFVSGDDDLFLHLLLQRTSWRARYSVHPDTVVPAAPPANWTEFFHQRIRHASKGFIYPASLKAGLVGVYLFNLLLLACLLVGFFHNNFLILAGMGFAVKSISEWLLLRRGAKIFLRTHYQSVFPLAALLHIPYVVLFGTLGQCIRFQWKSEKFSTQLAPTMETEKDTVC